MAPPSKKVYQINDTVDISCKIINDRKNITKAIRKIKRN